MSLEALLEQQGPPEGRLFDASRFKPPPPNPPMNPERYMLYHDPCYGGHSAAKSDGHIITFLYTGPSERAAIDTIKRDQRDPEP